MSYIINSTDAYPITIPDATATQDGVMTKVQAGQLASLVGGATFFTMYTSLTRPAANAVGAVAGVKTVAIWNSTSNQINISDGVNWYDALGELAV